MIFGASGGIGSALSKRLLAQPGSTVVLAGREEGKLQQLQQTVGGGVPIVGDALDSKQVIGRLLGGRVAANCSNSSSSGSSTGTGGACAMASIPQDISSL